MAKQIGTLGTAVYVRERGDDSGEVAESIGRQINHCTEYLSKQTGLAMPPLVFVDASFAPGGKGPARPALCQLEAAIACGEIGAVLCYSLDRLTRGMRQWAEFQQLCCDHGVDIHVVNRAP